MLLLATRGLARGPALVYALLTGLLIGIYTVWDGHAVRASHAEPLVYLLLANITIVLVLTPAAARDRAGLRLLMRDHRRVVAVVGVLVTLSYALVLFATRIAGVAYVAPVREVSILVGTVVGTRYYAERGGWQRIAGAAAIVGGVIALALGWKSERPQRARTSRPSAPEHRLASDLAVGVHADVPDAAVQLQGQVDLRPAGIVVGDERDVRAAVGREVDARVRGRAAGGAESEHPGRPPVRARVPAGERHAYLQPGDLGIGARRS